MDAFWERNYKEWVARSGLTLNRDERKVLHEVPDAWPEPTTGGWVIGSVSRGTLSFGHKTMRKAWSAAADLFRNGR